MNTATKVTGYVAGLAVLFGAALWVGTGIDAAPPPSEHAGEAGHSAQEHGGHDGEAGPPAGLQVSQSGYTMVVHHEELPAGKEDLFQFRIDGPDGEPVTDYRTTHDKDLHLIVVRRDFTGYQHLHPELDSDGWWTMPLTLDEPGEYRAFADFAPSDLETGLTLGIDVSVAGEYSPSQPPEPAATDTVDDYEVTLDGELVAGEAADLSLTVTHDGDPVTDLEPYLAAYGHLVALRDGDLAFLHVHPHGEPGDGTTKAGPQIDFTAEVPSPGVYRLYLDFKHNGAVRTAEFTVEAAGHDDDDDGDHGH
jgi:hypothetical protein